MSEPDRFEQASLRPKRCRVAAARVISDDVLDRAYLLGMLKTLKNVRKSIQMCNVRLRTFANLVGRTIFFLDLGAEVQPGMLGGDCVCLATCVEICSGVT